MARTAAQLWQNAFWTICNFSFFDAEKLFRIFFFGINDFFKKVAFWRSYEFLIRVGRCVVKSYCPNCPYFRGDFFGEGVKDSICGSDLDLALKMTSTMWLYVMI